MHQRPGVTKSCSSPYFSNGHVKEQTDPLGHTTSYDNYDALGNPGTITDANGVTTTNLYDTAGNIQSSSTPWSTHPGTPAITIYSYDPNMPGDVLSITNPDQTATTATYDPYTGLVRSLTNPQGTTTFGYDQAGHQVWSVTPAGNTTGGTAWQHRAVSEVNAAGETLTSVDPNGQGITDGFAHGDSASLGSTATGESWSAVAGSWGVAGHVATAAAGTSIATVPTHGTMATGVAASMVVAGASIGPGLAFRIHDANNYWFVNQRPDLGGYALSKVIAGVATQLGILNSPINPGDQLMIGTSTGGVLVYVNGTLIGFSTDTYLNTSVTTGLFSSAAGPVAEGFVTYSATGGATWSYYDASGKVIETLGPTSSLAGQSKTLIGHDAAGRVTSVKDPNQHTTRTGFDLAGRMTSQTDANNQVTSYGHDTLGRISSSQAPGKAASNISYTFGTATTPATKTVTEPSGATVITTMDAAGRPVNVNYSDTTPDVAYVYDNAGRTLQENTTGSAASVARTYDSLGELTSVLRDGRLVNYTYAAPGKLATIKYPFGQIVTEGYDTQGRWNAVTDWNSTPQTTTYGYDADGNVATVTDPGGVVTTRTFDANANPSSITVTKGTSTLASWAYDRGSDQGLTGVTATGVGTSTTWTSDPAAQLTSQSASPAQTFGYDPAGNPTTFAGNAQAFDASSEICWTATTSAAGSNRSCGTPPTGAKAFVYDANGNRTGAGTTTYAWNAAGEMTATNAGGGASYRYDPDGLRVTQTTGGVTHHYSWDDTAGIPELLSDDTTNYLYGPDGLPTEQITSTASIWLHQDATGSVRCTTDASGTITTTESWTPWGTLAAHTGTPPTLGYNSQQTDPSGLIYLRARYYDPATGTFVTPDPLAAMTGERYGYASNGPIINSDPSGLIVTGQCLGASASTVLAIEGVACIVTDGRHSGVLVFAGAGTGSPELGVTGSTFVSTADSVTDLSGAQACARLSLGDAIGGSVESCTSRSGSDTSVFLGGGGELEPAGSMSVGVMYAKYYSWSDIYSKIIKRIFGCGDGPPPTRYHHNSDGGYGSGGVSPDMDGNGVPLPR